MTTVRSGRSFERLKCRVHNLSIMAMHLLMPHPSPKTTYAYRLSMSRSPRQLPSLESVGSVAVVVLFVILPISVVLVVNKFMCVIHLAVLLGAASVTINFDILARCNCGQQLRKLIAVAVAVGNVVVAAAAGDLCRGLPGRIFTGTAAWAATQQVVENGHSPELTPVFLFLSRLAPVCLAHLALGCKNQAGVHRAPHLCRSCGHHIANLSLAKTP
mmetsp:Transcript_93839/g.268957  ORF Transcript_93839/g.268957 Transcript_93839/m.268957 type:complete len:215 (-) Transcript_93839:1696-2340(-)